MTAMRPHAAARRARYRGLCARQEQRAGRRQGVQTVVERDAARAEPARDRGLSRPAADHLEDYPDGSASELREAIGRAFGLDPDRIVCGAGSDDLLHLLAHAYLVDGDEAIHTTHGFLIYPIVTLGAGAKPVVAPEKNYTADVDAILAAVTKKTKIVFLANPNNPTGTCLSFDEVKRLHRGLPGNVLLGARRRLRRICPAQRLRSRHRACRHVRKCRDVPHVFENPRPGGAAARLDVRPGAIVDAVNRVRGPFNVTGPAIAAGIAAIEDVEHQERSREHNTRWLDWLTAGDRQARPQSDAERRQFRADPFSARPKAAPPRTRTPFSPRAGSFCGRPPPISCRMRCA